VLLTGQGKGCATPAAPRNHKAPTNLVDGELHIYILMIIMQLFITFSPQGTDSSAATLSQDTLTTGESTATAKEISGDKETNATMDASAAPRGPALPQEMSAEGEHKH